MPTDIINAINELKKNRIVLPKAQTLPNDETLDLYDNELGFCFPDDYRLFLKEASDSILNGKDALRVTDEMDSPRELIKIAKNAWQEGVPESWLPICEDNGNYYCITADGDVRYWSHDGPTDERWPDLATWIESVWLNEE
ncbi:SMI1/KNR4 family protein [Idiomarina tyrosinivorans]|uniref:SMI1/KNR4 family protein n=1 Tax=Idiomarina tyrosinivorans TaxID=1445662 RepID=A0A432ZR67_9GAMM|nr:SMI1/KNR4 family protein [Idiomarina tyrosinivorans]RUO80373.1 SMI1/KNR4 family protein [Idiomarina tyrosinivorans]